MMVAPTACGPAQHKLRLGVRNQLSRSTLFYCRALGYVLHAGDITEAPCSPSPSPSLKPNTYAYESEPMVKATGFREYDARWLFEKEINLMGMQALGLGLGTLLHETGREAGDRHRPRFPLLFRLDQDCAGHRA